MKVKENITKYICGQYGYALKENGNWKVYGGKSSQTEGNEIVYAIEPSLFEKVSNDTPVYASIYCFQSELTGYISYKEMTKTYDTKKDIIEICKEILLDYDKPQTENNINYLAEYALEICDYQEITGYLSCEVGTRKELPELPDE